MNIPQQMLQSAKTILDVGGWFKPEARATHVVDLMPWETRGVSLNLKTLPGEQFTKDTWFQSDFLSPGFQLPFGDKSFDLVICGQTVEDLADPSALLTEMQRVGRAGFIESPSRFSEQTAGLRDRESQLPGHPHHHWIAEVEGGGLVLYSKKDSLSESSRSLIPLCFFEESKLTRNINMTWKEVLSFRLVRGEECLTRARQTVEDLKIPKLDRLRDIGLRLFRRQRSRWKGKKGENFSWWKEIVEKSRPYSSIPLP